MALSTIKTNSLADDAVTWWMPSEVNTLYLFPSWLNHCVEANENKTEERISISFNTSSIANRRKKLLESIKG